MCFGRVHLLESYFTSGSLMRRDELREERERGQKVERRKVVKFIVSLGGTIIGSFCCIHPLLDSSSLSSSLMPLGEIREKVKSEKKSKE